MSSAWDHWPRENVDGHAAELAVLSEHAPDCSMAECAVADDAPCVVGLEHGRIVVVRAGRHARPVEWGTPPVWVSVKRDDRGDPYGSATIHAGMLSVEYAPIPFALAVEVICAAS